MATTPAPTGPSVSVCMAVYNGARWLTPQLDSILVELRSDDEIERGSEKCVQLARTINRNV